MYPRKMKGKRVRQCCEIQRRCIWFKFRYASIELILDESLKIILLADEGNEREDIQLINDASLDISTYEWKYNMVYKKTLHFLFWSNVLFNNQE